MQRGVGRKRVAARGGRGENRSRKHRQHAQAHNNSEHGSAVSIHPQLSLSSRCDPHSIRPRSRTSSPNLSTGSAAACKTARVALRHVAITGGSATERLERPCVRFDGDAPTEVTVGDVEIVDGTVQVDVAVTGERSFPGLAWRVRGNDYESFFVRPHQSGNPDAVQYTPVFNAVSGWQLYHGTGFWATVDLPTERWFTLRVCFAEDRGEAYIDDLETPVLAFARLRAPVAAGRLAILPGGPGMY